MKAIKKFLAGVSVSCVSLVSVGAASAATITGVTGFITSGSDMNGMQVTVNFQGGATNTAIFGATGSGSGAAEAGDAGGYWFLTQSGLTGDGPWRFTNNTSSVITSLFINAILGNTVFDIIPSPIGTPNSSGGLPFTFISGERPTSFQYDNIVNVSGSAPVGDLFGDLTLSWANGFAPGKTLSFLADTDNAIAVTDPTNNAKPVPVPGFVVGIVLAAGFFSSKEINKRKTKLQETEV